MTSPTELPVSADELKPDERVRVVIEAIFRGLDADGDVMLSIGGVTNYFNTEEVGRMSFARLPKPLEVGDRVQDHQGWKGRIRAIDDGEAWVSWTAPYDSTVEPLSSLTRIQEG